MWFCSCDFSKFYWRGRYYLLCLSFGKIWVVKCLYKNINIVNSIVIVIFILLYFFIFFIFVFNFFFQCDGILCDGLLRENVIFIVVDCCDIDNGNFVFFRIGLIFKFIILNIFEILLKRYGKMQKSIINGIIQVNGVFEEEINK